MAKAKREKRYQPWCTRCYSCHLGEATNSKRAAWRTAGNHAAAYHHDVDVTDAVEVARRQAERQAQKSVTPGQPTL